MEEKHLLFLGLAAISLLVLVVIGGGAIALISTPAKTPTPTIVITPTPTPYIVHVDSVDNTTRYTANDDGSIDIIRLRDNARMRNIPISKNRITSLSLNDNNTRLMINTNNQNTYTLNLTVYTVTQIPIIEYPTNSQVLPTSTPVITPTVRPTQDMTSEKRFVVIITPTPTIVLDKSIKISATIDNPVQINDNISIKTYIETHDTPLHDILVRLNISYYSKEHDWQGLGYIPIESSKILSLPAHSKTEKDLGPIKITSNGIILPDGSVYNFHVWATVYKIKIDLIDRTDGGIVGSTELNNVQVVKVDQYGQRTFDWLV